MKKKAVIKNFLLFNIILFFTATFFKGRLPDKKDILEQLYTPPIQTKTEVCSFKTIRNKITYTVSPLYNYELYGLVVSCFHTSTWWNIYHKNWKDFLNKKDICVIWADNIKNEVYKKMRFKSTSFECAFYTADAQTWSNFRNDCLSNNHLLSGTEQINKTIMSVESGDQIHLKGYLAEYSHSENSFKRTSSTTRTDTGAWSCEVIYVTELQILKKANIAWRFIYKTALYSIIGCIFLAVIFFFKGIFY